MAKRKHVTKRCFLCDENSGLDYPFEVAYHRFPSVPRIKKLWMDFCNLDEKRDNVSNVYICSLHFEDNDYSCLNAKEFGGRLRLKKTAVPSIIVPRRKRKRSLSVKEEPSFVSPPLCQILELVPSTSKVTSLTSLNDGGIFGLPDPSIHEINSVENVMCLTTAPEHSKEKSPDVSTLKRIEQELSFALEKVERQRKKIKIINQRNRRLTKRVMSLQELVKQLRNKALISEEARLVMAELAETYYFKKKKSSMPQC